MSNTLHNFRKIILNFALVVSTIILTSNAFSASSEESDIQTESKTTSTENLIKDAEKELDSSQKLLEDGNKSTKAELEKAAEQLDKLQKQLDEQQEIYNKRPRILFLGARTKNYQAALYVEAWRKKVEKMGNENYPKAAAADHVYGKVQATVLIMSDGTVEAVEINKSSGHKILDDHVMDTLKKAAPYEKFSDELKKYCDLISITRTWEYLSEPVAGADGAQNWFLEEVEN